jgi:tetratricopeptide (TPR) repeat protein
MPSTSPFRLLVPLLPPLIALTAAVGTAGDTKTTTKTIEDVQLSPATLAHACSPIEGEYGISIQARTHYSMADEIPIEAIRPARKSYQSFSCSDKKSTIYYYEYPTAKDLEGALGYTKALIWGEGGRSSMHPEYIFPIENVLVIISSRDAEFFANAFFYGVPGKEGEEFNKATEAYGAQNYAKAEKQFRALTRSTPDLALGHLYLGHSLYYQRKFHEAIPSYERARDLSAKGAALRQVNERILTDNLGIAYALDGRLPDSKALFEAAIRKDPQYPMYYYNLACTFAEMDDLDHAVDNLKLGFARKGQMLPGEDYPDPRTDDSFKRYLGNAKFQAAMKELGY